MRTKFSLALIVLVMTAWAVAQQQSTTSPSAPAQGSMPSTHQPSEPGQATAPNAPSTGGQMAASGEPDVIEGCLGGATPNFTVTDSSGKAYKLDIPAGADLSVLTRHVGESVQVMGAVSDGAAGGSAAGAADSDAKGKGATIAVQKIGRGKSSCPASAGGAGAAKPPSK